MDDGASFGIDLGVTGGDQAVSAAQALDALASKLQIAGSASSAASEAMKAGQAAYNQAESSANRAALAVEKIGIAADAQRGKLKAAMDAGDGKGADAAAAKLQNLVARQGEAVTKAASATAAMNAEATALDKLKASASAADAAEAKLNKEHDQAKKGAKAESDAAEEGSVNLRALSGAFGKLGGPLGSFGQQIAGIGGAFQKFSKLLGDSGPYVAGAVALIAVAAAAAVVTIAIIAATAAIAKFAVIQADAARTSSLLSAGVAHSVAGGELLDAQLDDLATKVPIARDELLSMAKGLSDGGLRGKALADSLQNAAVKAAQLKFGPNFQKQLLSLDSQSTRLKTNISTLFGGLKIEGLLEAFSKLVGLFDANSASGKAIKVVFETLFQPLIDGVTAFIPKMVTAFIQFEILVLKALIAIAPFKQQIILVAAAFGVLAALVITGLVAPIVVLIGVIAAVVTIISIFLATLYSAARAAIEFGVSLLDGAGGAFDSLMATASGVVDWLSALSLADIGVQLIQGLIDGITGAGGGVLTAITGIAGGAVDAAKKALGIASPSKVFAEIGMHTAAGMEQGVEGGASGVQDSVEAMTAAPEAGGSGGASPAAASGGGGGGGATYIIQLSPKGDDAQSYVEAFRAYLEGLGAQNGSAVPSAS